MSKHAKGLFITGTGTDIGKTYVTALLIKKMRENGYACGYYKAALSGAPNVAASDAGYVNKIAQIGQSDASLVTYLYQNAVSPHLAAQIEGNPVDLTKVKAAFAKTASDFDYITVEGSGGIVCPIRWDAQEKLLLGDIVKALHLPSLLIADAGLGTINAVVLTVEYMQHHGLPLKGIILNNYIGDQMQQDNIKMIEALTPLKVIATVAKGAQELQIDAAQLAALYE